MKCKEERNVSSGEAGILRNLIKAKVVQNGFSRGLKGFQGSVLKLKL
jgi:hypothetical protein